MARSRYRIFENEQPYFLTCTVVNWLPIFGRQAIAQIVLDSFKFLQDQERLNLYAYVILENHLHCVASSKNLSKEIGNFKSFTARKMIDFFEERKIGHILKQLEFYTLQGRGERAHQIWQKGSHPLLIQSQEMMNQKIEYIHKNPVKRGYVDDPLHWRYSSARNYAGREGLLDVTRI